METFTEPTFKTRATLKLVGMFDQSRGCTVKLIPTGLSRSDYFVVVRPKGRRRDYRLLLSDLARYVILKTAQHEAQTTERK